MSHTAEGLKQLWRSYAFLAEAGAAGVLGIQDLSSGQVARGGVCLGVSLLALGFGMAQRVHAQDLLSRSPDDFSPPDPIMKEIPVVGPLCYKWANQNLASRAPSASPQGKISDNASRPSL